MAHQDLVLHSVQMVQVQSLALLLLLVAVVEEGVASVVQQMDTMVDQVVEVDTLAA